MKNFWTCVCDVCYNISQERYETYTFNCILFVLCAGGVVRGHRGGFYGGCTVVGGGKKRRYSTGPGIDK